MLNLLRTKVVPTKTKSNHTQSPVHRWRLRNLHTSPLKPSFINTNRRFQTNVPNLQSFCNNKLTTAHLFGNSFFFRQQHTVPEKYKKYSTILSDAAEEEELKKKKEDWGPAYSDEVINEIDRRRKMKWMKHVPKGIPTREEEAVPPELHRIIPPVPLGGEYRYESKWQWPRKIYDMKKDNDEFMERGRELVRWRKKWRDRWRKLEVLQQWIDDNARFPKIFITRRRTFWIILLVLCFLYYWDAVNKTGYWVGKEWERYIKHVMANPMNPPTHSLADMRLQHIRADESIHRFATKKGQVLPVLEIHTSRYNEPKPLDNREDDQIKIHVSQPPVHDEDTWDMTTTDISEFQLPRNRPLEKRPVPETRQYPLTKLPRPDLEVIPEAPQEHHDQRTTLHAVLSGNITPTFYVGMFDQHNTRHAQDFAATQLIDYVKMLLDWKRYQQNHNDWIVNAVSDMEFDPAHDNLTVAEKEQWKALSEKAKQFKGWSLDKWNKDNPTLRQVVKELAGEPDATDSRIDHIILKLRNIYDISRAIPASFFKAFKAADHDFMMNAYFNPQKFHEGFSGACAMVAMFFNRWIFVGSVGDFRAFVVKRVWDQERNGFHWSLQSVSFPHTPVLDAEIGTRTHQHAIQHGLIVEEKGIGFGPRKLQQWKDAAKSKAPLDTTAEPHLNSYQVQQDDACVVLVSPGVLNVMRAGEIRDLLSKKLDGIEEGVDKLENAASMIVYAAAARSKDLIDPLSASVVFLNPKYHETVPPSYEIPAQYEVKTPPKQFEFAESWADSRQLPPLPLRFAADIGEWTESISLECAARLSRHWELHVKPHLPNLQFEKGSFMPIFIKEFMEDLSTAWKDFRQQYNPQELSKQANDYMHQKLEEKVDDQYYRWLKRSFDQELWPSEYHSRLFVREARKRGRDIDIADKVEQALYFHQYTFIKGLRQKAFYARKPPPQYPEEMLQYFRDKFNVDFADLTYEEQMEKEKELKLKEEAEKKTAAEERKKKAKERAEEKAKRLAERAASKEKETAEKETTEKVAEKKEKKIKEKAEEAPSEEITDPIGKRIAEREKKEYEENMEEYRKYLEQMDLLNNLNDDDSVRYTQDRRRVYLDPNLVVVKVPATVGGVPRVKEEEGVKRTWQDSFRPVFYVVQPKINREYQHVLAANMIEAAVEAASGTLTPEEEATFVYNDQAERDLSTPALRQAFYEPYSDEILKEVSALETSNELKEKPATAEYTRRNPPKPQPKKKPPPPKQQPFGKRGFKPTQRDEDSDYPE